MAMKARDRRRAPWRRARRWSAWSCGSYLRDGRASQYLVTLAHPDLRSARLSPQRKSLMRSEREKAPSHSSTQSSPQTANGGSLLAVQLRQADFDAGASALSPRPVQREQAQPDARASTGDSPAGNPAAAAVPARSSRRVQRQQAPSAAQQQESGAQQSGNGPPRGGAAPALEGSERGGAGGGFHEFHGELGGDNVPIPNIPSPMIASMQALAQFDRQSTAVLAQISTLSPGARAVASSAIAALRERVRQSAIAARPGGEAWVGGMSVDQRGQTVQLERGGRFGTLAGERGVLADAMLRYEGEQLVVHLTGVRLEENSLGVILGRMSSAPAPRQTAADTHLESGNREGLRALSGGSQQPRQ